MSFELISDLFKEANGFRPSTDYIASFHAMSAASKEAEWDALIAKADAEAEYEREREADNLADFNGRVTDMMAQFNISQGTAIRWLLDADGISIPVGGYVGAAKQEIGFYFYTQGIGSISTVETFMPTLIEEFQLVEVA